MRDRTNGEERRSGAATEPETTQEAEAPEAAQAASSHRTRAEERIAALDASPARLAEELQELKERLSAAEQEAGEARQQWQRSAADFANYKRRTEQERQATLGLANEMLLLKLLAVVDDFDRALAAMPKELEHLGWIEGVWLVERKLRALLESEGVTPIEAAGKPFNPREHEAVVSEETTTAPEDTVLGELQRGYRIRDRVLRPALVTVAKNPGQAAASGGNE
ncbi:MAG: nucleotide exchange factor GrpE [Chloroflexi bacterium]|nr:nucleotide exchange factor GrpE [Chloroflexota bacterium]